MDTQALLCLLDSWQDIQSELEVVHAYFLRRLCEQHDMSTQAALKFLQHHWHVTAFNSRPHTDRSELLLEAEEALRTSERVKSLMPTYPFHEGERPSSISAARRSTMKGTKRKKRVA